MTTSAATERSVTLTRASWAALVVAIQLFASVMMSAAHRGHGYDLIPVLTAGRLEADGNRTAMYAHDPVFYNLIGDAQFVQASRELGFALEPTPFVYPPLVALAAQPVTRIPFDTVLRVWDLASLVFMLGALALMLWVYAPDRTSPATLALLVLAACAFEPIVYGFWLGQTTALVFLAIILSIALERVGWFRIAGILLGVAAFVKITPLLLVPVWLWRRSDRAAIWCAASLAALWVLSFGAAGPDLNRAYLDRVISIAHSSITALNNHSLVAFVTRLLGPAPVDWRLGPTPLAASLFSLGIVAAIIGAAARAWRRSPAAFQREGECLALALIVMIPNIAWTHYFVLLLPGIVLTVSRTRTHGAVPCVLGLLAFVLCCRPVIPPQEALPALGRHLIASGPTIAALLVCIALIWSQGSPHRADGESRYSV